MDKTTFVARAGGVTLCLISLWAALSYRGVAPYLVVAVLGVAVAVAPETLAYLKFRVQSYRTTRASDSDGIFVSTQSVDDWEATFDRVRRVLETDAVGEVTSDEFSEGKGLNVVHAGFHRTSVRITPSGTVTVSGISEASDTVVDAISAGTSLSFAEASRNPNVRPDGIRGGFRVLLAVVLVVTLITGVGGVANVAYPTDEFNTAEKTVLMEYDLRGDVDPGFSSVDVRFEKTAFLVRVLAEKPVEIRWAGNDSQVVRKHARGALSISTTARARIAALEAADLSPTQRTRIERLESDLRRAEGQISDVLADERRNANVTGPKIRPIEQELARRANTSVDQGTNAAMQTIQPRGAERSVAGTVQHSVSSAVRHR